LKQASNLGVPSISKGIAVKKKSNKKVCTGNKYLCFSTLDKETKPEIIKISMEKKKVIGRDESRPNPSKFNFKLLDRKTDIKNNKNEIIIVKVFSLYYSLFTPTSFFVNKS
jgi:hypothetical protein